MTSDFKLYHIAKLYYVDKKKQAEIAEIYGVSIMLISRMLKKAEEQGIVTVNIKQPINLDESLGRRLISRYPQIRECLATREGPELDSRQQLGRLAAEYVSSVMHKDSILGLSLGKSIYEFVQAMPTKNMPNCHIIQLKGGFLNLSDHLPDPANLVRTMGEKLSCTSLNLNAPIFVANREIRDQLESDPANSHLLKIAERADINVYGMSALGRESTMFEVGVLSSEDIDELKSLNTVGDIDGTFLDTLGNEVVWSKSECSVGVRLDTLSKARHAVCLASGVEKAAICRVGLEKGLFNVLIVTHDLAEKLLSL